jgi:hypothetical protein
MRSIPRSMLFTPATKAGRFTAAASVGSDAVILDLDTAFYRQPSIFNSAVLLARAVTFGQASGRARSRLRCKRFRGAPNAAAVPRFKDAVRQQA